VFTEPSSQSLVSCWLTLAGSLDLAYAQQPLPTLGFSYRFALDRTGRVTPGQQLFLDVRPVFDQVRFEVFGGNAVNPGRTLVGPDFLNARRMLSASTTLSTLISLNTSPVSCSVSHVTRPFLSCLHRESTLRFATVVVTQSGHQSRMTGFGPRRAHWEARHRAECGKEHLIAQVTAAASGSGIRPCSDMAE